MVLPRKVSKVESDMDITSSSDQVQRHNVPHISTSQTLPSEESLRLIKTQISEPSLRDSDLVGVRPGNLHF